MEAECVCACRSLETGGGVCVYVWAVGGTFTCSVGDVCFQQIIFLKKGLFVSHMTMTQIQIWLFLKINKYILLWFFDVLSVQERVWLEYMGS